MKKIFFPAVILILLGINPQAQAGFWNLKPKAKTPAKEKTPKAVPSAVEAKRKIEARAKESLAAKDWTVYLTPIEGKKAVTDMDVLAFSEGKFTSNALLNKGYATANFIITVSDNGTAAWETVQTAENGDMAAWRGQLEAGVMSGILSMHTLKGKLEDYYFTSVTSKQ